jgi:type I restriction enzyme S subunit
VSDLPHGWASGQIGDLIAGDGLFVDGDWVETKDQDPDGDVRLTQLADVGDGVFRDRSNRFLTSEKARKLGCTYLATGDVLVARMPEPLGRACIFPGDPRPCVTAVDVCVIRPGPGGVDARWLMWWINTPQFRREVLARQAGTTRKRISRRNLATIEFPLPPSQEQGRIAATIDEHVSRLDSAAESLDRAKRRLARFRASTISAAVKGAWQLVTLREVTASQIYGSSAKANTDATGVPILRMGNIRDGALDFDELKYLPADHPDVEKCQLEPGDLLFNRTNSPELVGKSAVFKRGPEPTVFASYLIRVRLTRECNPDWAALVINSHLGRRYVESVRTQQVGQANVNGTKLAAMPIPLPPVEEQRRIIQEVERQLSLIDAMDAEIDKALRRSAALRRTILEQAFTGKLVPQDPSDEPASVLLGRIAAEHAAAPKPSRRKRKIPA